MILNETRGPRIYGQTDGDHKTEVITVDYSRIVSERPWSHVKPKHDEYGFVIDAEKKLFSLRDNFAKVNVIILRTKRCIYIFKKYYLSNSNIAF